jgi:hypothetical protein
MVSSLLLSSIGAFWLTSGCLGAGKGLLSGNEAVNVVKVIALGWGFISYLFLLTRSSLYAIMTMKKLRHQLRNS